MTVDEFSNSFDIKYNSIATNSAPSIDLYEKSVFLTDAQLEIIKNYFNPLGNKYRKGFEQTSKRRYDLKELVKPGLSTTVIVSSDGIDINSQFFKIASDIFLIIQEKSKVSSSDLCINNTFIKTVPKTHDEYNIQIDNPFKKPDKSVIWRLDSMTQGNNKNVELISPYTIIEYKYRYIKYPSPIILTDFDTTFPGENLTIDGAAINQTCTLNEGIHREILNRAVEMATADYNPKDLAVKTRINNRNE